MSEPSTDHPATETLSRLERAVLAHVAIMVVFGAWAFGGGAEWVRVALAGWGALGVGLLLAWFKNRSHHAAPRLGPLVWLWPLALLNLLTVVACFSPSFRAIGFGGEPMLVKIDRPAWLPSSARPAAALFELGLFNALYLSAFNVLVIIRHRRALRGLLLLLSVNALLLAVFGTIQKLTGAQGLFFGRVPAPHDFFFSTFVYHNHWGSFALLMIAATLGLVWHYARRRDDRDSLHSPVFTWVLCALVLAAAVPLSGSRASSALLLLLLGGSLWQLVAQIVRRRRRHRESVARPLAAVLAALTLAAGAVWFVAGKSIEARAAKTREQVGAMRAEGTIGARAVLYRDTWHMARDRLWFGWGVASYPHVFQLYTTIRPNSDRLPIYYADAHSDWLQSLAERGIIGTTLLVLCALAPLAGLRWRDFGHPIARYLLAGCALVLLYAAVEFPFGNAVVVFTWWLCFFAALRFARLERRAERGPSR
jgi:O-antigen ligase